MKCRVCSHQKLKPLLSLGNQYLADFRNDRKKPPRYPLNLVYCPACALVQLDYTVSRGLLYHPNYGYKSSVNSTIRANLADITKIARKLIPRGQVLDIGSNDGTLLSYFPARKFRRIAFEPVKRLCTESTKYADVAVNEFFNAGSYLKSVKSKADIICAISMFYDIDNPNRFLDDMTRILAPKGIIIIQQNYLGSMVKKNAFDNIVHEHLTYYSLATLENILDKHNLGIFDLHLNNINGGSFMTIITRKENISSQSNAIANTRKKERTQKLNQYQTLKRWSQQITKITNQLYDFINTQHQKGCRIYLYGASTRGNTLVQSAGLNHKLITAAVERNPEKFGKIYSSMGIPIISEAQARAEKPDYMLVAPWFFRDEIVKREREYLKDGGHLIFPLPKLEVV